MKHRREKAIARVYINTAFSSSSTEKIETKEENTPPPPDK